MIYLLLVKDPNQDGTQGQGQVRLLRLWLGLVRSNYISVDSGAHYAYNDALSNFLSQFDAKLFTKNIGDSKVSL